MDKTHQRVYGLRAIQEYETVNYKNTKDFSIENCKQIVSIVPSGFD